MTSGLNSARRQLMATGAALACGVWVRPASAQTSAQLESAIAAYTGGAVPQPGKVKLDINELVENGNVVPVTITVDSPMTSADHVQRIALFNERNPERDVGRFTLGPRSGRASVSTRIRLSTSQQLVAVAQLSDGSWWSHRVDVLVTLAACIEG